MAYPYRGAHASREDSQYGNGNYTPMSPPRNPNRLSGGMISSNDARVGLTRRFTTNALPTLSPIGQQRRQAAGEAQIAAGIQSRFAPSERKIRHIEGLLEQQRRIAAELEQVDGDTRREIEDTLRHERAVNQIMAQSEPTTPPEYQDAFSGSVNRPNRYSTASLSSQSSFTTRAKRSSTQLTSPPAGVIRPYTAAAATNIPSQSVPGSRRQSDDEEEEDDFLFYETSMHRAAANPNRNSMPVTTYDRNRNAGSLAKALGPLNTTSFLFDDDDKTPVAPSKSNQTSPPDTKTYLQMQHTADGFPKLIRRDDNGELVSGSSAALDLALSNSEKQVTDRPTATRHRISLPPSALSSGGNIAPLNSILANSSDKSSASNRRSMEVKFTAETKRPALLASPPHGMANGTAKSQSSYSTNDIPTLKSINGSNVGGVSLNSPPTQSINLANPTSPDQPPATVIRPSAGSLSSVIRQSQDLTPIAKPQENGQDSVTPQQSYLQLNASSFGGIHTQDPTHLRSLAPPAMTPYGPPAYYNGYGLHMLSNGFSNMNISGGYGAQAQWPNQMQPYQQGGYGGYQQYPQGGQAGPGAGRYNDSQRASMQQRKQQADDFYNSVTVQDLIGEIYNLCKDQHGCRFLQKKLEERDDKDVETIFNEVKNHFQELMTDPFGNYLCQRLLEYATDEQRTVLVQNAGPSMSRIALNQHGTRALQKMIESISTQEQTNMIIEALRDDVVMLIQDLNGNHVIQKCLNHLSALDAQFIFDAVGANCVTVGTHRHGCCVLQRCVDHASGLQKGAMVDHIIDNAFALVQDPFGNYVVQYILDLAEPCFTEPLCRSFVGNVALLSKQKFSSNVMEKCMRCSGPEVKRLLIIEIAKPIELERLLRDSFANYVVQTAIDFADEDTKGLLIENIRPMMPAIRHTPHGRRITGKIADYDTGPLDIPGIEMPRRTAPPANNLSAFEPIAPPNTDAAPSASSGPPPGRGNRSGIIGAPAQWQQGQGFMAPKGTGYAPNGAGYGGDMNAPPQQRQQAYQMLNGTQSQPSGPQGQPAFGQPQSTYGQSQPNYGQPQPNYGQSQPNYAFAGYDYMNMNMNNRSAPNPNFTHF